MADGKSSGFDSFELNKIAGGVLGTLLFVMALGVISDAIFSRPHMHAPGYALPATEAPAAGGGGPVAEVTPLPVLLAKADPKKGEAAAKVCTTCHVFDKGAPPKATGPNLHDVAGRKMASTDYPGYSDALKGKGEAWTYENLNTFITNPKGFVAGTKMSFGGEKDPAKRADLIAYLKSITDNAPAFPAAN